MGKFWKPLVLGALSVGASVFMESAAQADGYERGFAQPAFSWSGIYLGGGGGYAWGDGLTDMSVSGVFIQRATPDLSGGIVGGHVGFNYQMGAVVVGAEAQILSGVKGGADAPAFAGGCFVGGVPCLVHGTVDVQSIDLLKGRLGYAFDRWLPYVTGGIASGDIRSKFQDVNFNGGTNVVSDKERHSAWVIGVGVDYALTRNWILGVEYQHIEFDSVLHQGLNNFGAQVPIRDHLVNADVDTVMARLSYKFGRALVSAPLK